MIGYGIVQASAPRIVRERSAGRGAPDGRTADAARVRPGGVPGRHRDRAGADVDPTLVIVVGLIAFGVVFALNSAVHSYLILAYADGDKVAMNVGFYYMANACGRLAGTVLSGLLYQWQGLEACLWASVAFVLAAGLLSLLLPRSAAEPEPQRGSAGATGSGANR